MDEKLQFPGLANTWTMRVENRLDMKLTGIKTPTGLKVQGMNVGDDSEGSCEMREADSLAGGGGMGERIRLHHWATTPLARVSDWPQPLLIPVSLCVKSQLPIG